MWTCWSAIITTWIVQWAVRKREIINSICDCATGRSLKIYSQTRSRMWSNSRGTLSVPITPKGEIINIRNRLLNIHSQRRWTSTTSQTRRLIIVVLAVPTWWAMRKPEIINICSRTQLNIEHILVLTPTDDLGQCSSSSSWGVYL